MKLQGLFVQAYQSYLFNRFLSERVKAGLPLNRAEVGDFVVGVERSGLPMVNMAKPVTVESQTKVNEALTAGKMRLALPIVGFKQKLSDGAMGELEQRVLLRGKRKHGWLPCHIELEIGRQRRLTDSVNASERLQTDKRHKKRRRLGGFFRVYAFSRLLRNGSASGNYETPKPHSCRLLDGLAKADKAVLVILF